MAYAGSLLSQSPTRADAKPVLSNFSESSQKFARADGVRSDRDHGPHRRVTMGPSASGGATGPCPASYE